MWKKAILGFHGSSRPWAMLPCSASAKGCWKQIVKVGEQRLPNGSTYNSLFSGSLGDGVTFTFWGDRWLGGEPLRFRYPHLFQLERDKWVKVAKRFKVSNNIKTMNWEWRRPPSTYLELTELFQLLEEIHEFNWIGGLDKWSWISNDGVFTVASAKQAITQNSLDVNPPKIKWKCWVPLKCKVMVWRAARNRLPTTSELLKRGVTLQRSSCVLCDADQETTQHLFTGCSFSFEVWNRIEVWCRLPPTIVFDVLDVIQMVDRSSYSKSARHILRGVVYSTMWVIWNERNARVFNNKHRRPAELVQIVKSTSFFWIRNRSRWKDIDWLKWCNHPLDLL